MTDEQQNAWTFNNIIDNKICGVAVGQSEIECPAMIKLRMMRGSEELVIDVTRGKSKQIGQMIIDYADGKIK